MKRRLLDWRTWLYGLGSALVGGAASAGGAWLGMVAAKYSGIDVPTLNFKALGIILISAGLLHAFFYLSKSPLPPVITESEAIADDVADVVQKNIDKESSSAPPK